MSDSQATNKSNSQSDVLKTAEIAENGATKGEIHNFDDSREQLEADVDTALYGAFMADGGYISLEMAIGWLDRQAAITERELGEYHDMGCGICEDEKDRRIAELEREIATLKEHRAANVEKLHELTDECAELRKYRDEWKGLAEKYRADSIAAQEESERYRAKLGDVLDAIREAERAAR